MIHEHGPGYGIGHDKGRAHQKVGAQVRMDARFEVAVAGKDRCADEIILQNGLFRPFIQGA